MSAAVNLQTVFNRFLPAYAAHHRLHRRQWQVCAHIRDCRTAALGGMVQRCPRCAFTRPRYHSCRDRHCTQCQGQVSAAWCERQLHNLLPVTYYHLVFTVPHTLNPWVQLYPRVLYAQLFDSAWSTLKAFAAEPRRLGGQLGMSAVLHTWGQTLTQHVHLHCLVPGGALTAGGQWRAAKSHYLFPTRALARRFRGHFVSALRRRVQRGELGRLSNVDTLLDTLMESEWLVYAKPCLGHTEQVVHYLARYTHRIALSDRRLLAMDEQRVALRYHDYRTGARNCTLWLDGEELVRRYLLHVLPKGLMRIRHFGYLANRCRRARLQQIRAALQSDTAAIDRAEHEAEAEPPGTPTAPRCPRCRRGALLPTVQLRPWRLNPG